MLVVHSADVYSSVFSRSWSFLYYCLDFVDYGLIFMLAFSLVYVHVVYIISCVIWHHIYCFMIRRR